MKHTLKLSKKDKQKIDVRFTEASKALNSYSLVELKEIFKTKMSSTDRDALVQVTQYKINSLS